MAITFNTHDRLIVIHAVFACIAVLGTAPAAILCARYMKHNQNPRWFVYHRALNIATVLLITLVFALGTAAVISQGVGYQFTGPQKDLHHDLGLGLFIVVVLQSLSGFFASKKSAKPQTDSLHQFLGKSSIRWIHIVAGITLMGLLITEAWLGFGEWNTMQSTGTFTPNSIPYLFLIIVAIEVAVYLYSASRAVLYKTVGEDGRGPWSKLEEVEGGDGGER